MLTLKTKGGLEAFDKDDDFDNDWLGVVNVGWGKLVGQRERSSAKRGRSARSSSSAQSPTSGRKGSSRHSRTSRTLSASSAKKGQTEKRDAPSSTKKAGKEPRAVFPSEQQRTLNIVNSVCIEAKAMLDLAGSPDGLGTLTFSKVEKMISKLSSKLDMSSKRVLTYAGPNGNDDAHAGLCKQGEAPTGDSQGGFAIRTSHALRGVAAFQEYPPPHCSIRSG